MGQQITQYGTQRSREKGQWGHRVGRVREEKKRKTASEISVVLAMDGG